MARLRKKAADNTLFYAIGTLSRNNVSRIGLSETHLHRNCDVPDRPG
jgi:hypothetical protein